MSSLTQGIRQQPISGRLPSRTLPAAIDRQLFVSRRLPAKSSLTCTQRETKAEAKASAAIP